MLTHRSFLTSKTVGKAAYNFIVSQANHVKRIDANTYRVKSQSGNGTYLVRKVGLEWVCGCPDHQFRMVECKHIHAVRLNLSLEDSKEIYEAYKQMDESYFETDKGIEVDRSNRHVKIEALKRRS